VLPTLYFVHTIHDYVVAESELRLTVENAAAMAQLTTREVVLREASSRNMDEACVSTEKEEATGASEGSSDESDDDS